jgi:hypothetical protein
MADDLNTLPSHPPDGPPAVSIPSMSSEEQTKLHAHYDELWKQVDEAAEHERETPPELPSAEPEAEHAEAHVREHQKPEPEEWEPKHDESPKPRKSKKPEAKAPSVDIIDQPIAPAAEKSAATGEPDLDSFQLHPNATEKQKSEFANLRAAAKRYKESDKTFRSKLAFLANEFGIELGDDLSALDQLAERVRAAKAQPALDQSTAQELEAYRASDRHYLTKSSHLYNQQYGIPIHNKFYNWLGRAAQYLPDAQTGKQFIDLVSDFSNQVDMQTGNKNGLDKYDGDWMRSQLEQVYGHGRMDKDTFAILSSQIPEVLDLKQKGYDFLKDVSQNAEKYQNFEQQNRQQYANDYQNLISDEVQKVIHQERTHLKEILPIDITKITDPQERAKAETHNQRFQQLERDFSTLVKDFNTGPRAAARRGMEFIELRENFLAHQKILEAKEAELKAANDENAQLRKESGAKRKVSDAPFSRNGLPSGTPTSKGTKPPAPKLGESNSRNSLRKAFDE